MNTYFAADTFQLSNVEVTDEGYIVARNSRIARTGVQTYYAYELGLDKEMGFDPMKVIRLNRSPEEVFAPDSLRSFEGAPLTIDHPAGGVTAENWKRLTNGDAKDIKEAGDFVNSTINIRSKDAATAYKAGKKQLSNGYTFGLDMTPGTNHKGEAFDGSQKNIRGNHVAMVDSARCGSACRIADSNPSTIGDSTMTTQKVTVDGIPLEVSDSAAGAINKLVTERDAAKGELKIATDKLATSVSKEAHDKAVAAKDTEIETLKKDVMTPAARDAMVADWAKMAADAKALAPDVTTEGKTCHVVRKEVVAAVIAKDPKAKAAADAILGGKTVEDADAEVVRTVFNVLTATVTPAGKQTTGSDAQRIGAAMASQQKQIVKAEDGSGKQVVHGRQAAIARAQDAWKQ